MQTNKLTDSEYEKLKVFFVRYLDWFIPAKHKSNDPDHQPLVFLANLEKKSMPNAKKGLQMAVNDMVEDTVRWTPNQVADADVRFAAEGCFTLSEVRRRYSKKYLQILKRGVIKSEKEYYILKGVVDGSSIEAGAIESTQIEAMMATFETELIRKLASE